MRKISTAAAVLAATVVQAGDSLPLERALPSYLLNNQYQQQLSAAHLRSFDHERTALAQFGVCFEQKFFLLIKFQIQNVTGFTFASRIDMQPEKFAGCQPVFLTGLECLAATGR